MSTPAKPTYPPPTSPVAASENGAHPAPSVEPTSGAAAPDAVAPPAMATPPQRVIPQQRVAPPPAHSVPPVFEGDVSPQDPAPAPEEGERQRIELVESIVVHASVTQEPLDLARARDEVAAETAGAVVVFEGVIRSHDGGQDDVIGLEYTAHPHASEYLTVVAGEIAAVNPGVRIFVQHRIGDLEVGDVALVAAVASAHRKEAFSTCSDLVDRVKERVPIWKQQHFASGSHEWVGL